MPFSQVRTGLHRTPRTGRNTGAATSPNEIANGSQGGSLVLTYRLYRGAAEHFPGGQRRRSGAQDRPTSCPRSCRIQSLLHRPMRPASQSRPRPVPGRVRPGPADAARPASSASPTSGASSRPASRRGSARNAAEVAAQEYLRNPPGDPDLSIPAPLPGDPPTTRSSTRLPRERHAVSHGISRTRTYIADDPGTPADDEAVPRRAAPCRSSGSACTTTPIRTAIEWNSGRRSPPGSPCTEL